VRAGPFRRIALGPKDRQLVAPSVRAEKAIPFISGGPKGRPRISRAPAALIAPLTSYPALTDGATDCRSVGPKGNGEPNQHAFACRFYDSEVRCYYGRLFHVLHTLVLSMVRIIQR
jgi:hypothetical protein